MLTRWWHYLAAVAIGMLVVAVAVAGLASALIYPSLPSLEALTDYRPKMPLRIYTEDGALIGEFGEERRAVVRIQETPPALKQAILAAEDDRFYEHGGVDTLGIARAAFANLVAGGAKEGASTITMQVARNFFLSSEKTLRRKINEALLAMKIEHTLSKDQILELYINHIYLGQRAYGFAAASQIYFGKPLAKIDLAEAAMLAGLPKAPSAYNPVVNPSRAKTRQLYVLRRMRELGYINADQFKQASEKSLPVRYSGASNDLNADHVAEMARQYAVQRYGEVVYSSGMKVYTTLRAAEQRAAVEAVRIGIAAYNRRRGYAGPEGWVAQPNEPDALKASTEQVLSERAEVNGLLPAWVTAASKERIVARLRNGETVELGPSEAKFAGAWLDSKLAPEKRLRPGAIIRVFRPTAAQPWQLTYLPSVEGAFIGLAPNDGAVRALVGGFNFGRNQFNHITQAWRQPGSSFKPFVYSAAIEAGITPATVFEDAPIVLSPAETGGELWEPKNYDGTMSGPTTVRNALTHSKNLVSIRLLQSAGVGQTRQHALQFGFTPERIQPYLTMALGVGEVTPLQLAEAYAIFANNGLRIRSYYLTRIADKDDRVLETFQARAPEPAIDARNSFIMTSLMQDVVRRGTGAAASRLGRGDIAGKTGTTNDHRDAWFAGYSPTRVGIAWMGFDQPKPLGPGETGGTTALPIWMHYMATALRGVPDKGFAMPGGISVVNVDPNTGARVASGGRAEYFYDEFAPDAAGSGSAQDLAWGQ
jgi:penicillin-binding protein 1A